MALVKYGRNPAMALLDRLQTCSILRCLGTNIATAAGLQLAYDAGYETAEEYRYGDGRGFSWLPGLQGSHPRWRS